MSNIVERHMYKNTDVFRKHMCLDMGDCISACKLTALWQSAAQRYGESLAARAVVGLVQVAQPVLRSGCDQQKPSEVTLGVKVMTSTSVPARQHMASWARPIHHAQSG